MKQAIVFIMLSLIKIHFLTAAITLYDLKCENLTNPNSIDNTIPHFSWKIQSDTPMQQQYDEMQVASDSLLLIQNKADL